MTFGTIYNTGGFCFYGGIANPSVQDAYGLISQLNEKKLALVVEYVKQLLKQNDDTVDSAHEDDDLSKKRAAFAKLMEIREKVALKFLVDSIKIS